MSGVVTALASGRHRGLRRVLSLAALLPAVMLVTASLSVTLRPTMTVIGLPLLVVITTTTVILNWRLALNVTMWLDEREVRDRDRVHTWSFGLYAAFVVIIVAVYSAAEQYRDRTDAGSLLPLLLFATYLVPAGVAAWLLPEAPRDDAVR